MDAEADQLCAGGANSRNGYRERNLATCVGDITLRISKLRSGSFFPITSSSTTSASTVPWWDNVKLFAHFESRTRPEKRKDMARAVGMI